MRSILVNYDSASSLADLVDSALNLKKIYGSSVTFAHISEKADEESKALEGKLNELIRQKNIPSGEIKFISRKGKTFSELPVLTRELHADTLITKAEQKKGFQLFKDNTAYHAVVNSPCPVITLTDGVKINSLRNVLLPIDTSAETRQKIPFAIHIGKHFDSVIHVVGFGTDKSNKEAYLKLKNYADQSRNFLHEKGIKSESHVEFGNSPIDLIKRFIKENSCDLVIITVDEETSIFSSSSEKLVYSSPVPVVCIQPKDLKVSWTGL